MFAGCAFLFAALLASNVCAARQSPAEMKAVAPATFTSPELDALTAKLAKEIAKRRIKSVVIVGFSGPENKVTELSAGFRGAFSDSLGRQVPRLRLIDAAAIRAFLTQNRISEDMLYSDSLGDWIATHMQTDGFITVKITSIGNENAGLTTDVGDWDSKDSIRRMWVKAEIPLTDAQIQAASRVLPPFVKERDEIPAREGYTWARCISCPKPPYTAEAKKLKIQGVVEIVSYSPERRNRGRHIYKQRTGIRPGCESS
jgi:hypothetical protein